MDDDRTERSNEQRGRIPADEPSTQVGNVVPYRPPQLRDGVGRAMTFNKRDDSLSLEAGGRIQQADHRVAPSLRIGLGEGRNRCRPAFLPRDPCSMS
jgi:hypothetical protein